MDSDVDRLLDEFDSGRLVRPDAESLNTVDLSRAIARWGGHTGVPESPGLGEVRGLLDEPDHLVMVAVDGLGMNFINDLPESSFLRSHVAREINSTYPSTTSVAFTTYATGQWPSQHGVTSWFVYLPEIDASTVILPFVRRSDGTSLEALGVTAQVAFPSTSLLTEFGKDVLFITPEEIADSVFSRYQRGDAPARGYDRERLDVGAEMAVDRVFRSSEPTFTFLYTPLLDGAAHEYGTGHETTQAVLGQVDRVIGELADTVRGRARVVVSSDHGHLDFPEEGAIPFEPRGELDGLLEGMPAGDSRIWFFRVETAKREEFADGFRDGYGEEFLLITSEELEELRLFGPEPFDRVTKNRVGDLVAISLGAAGMEYRSEDEEPDLRSAHSGLTPAEMRIPLVVA